MTARQWLRKLILPQAVRRSGLWRAAHRAVRTAALARGHSTLRLGGVRVRYLVTTPAEFRAVDTLGGEPEMLARLVDELRPGDTMLDVGANIGLFSITAAVGVEGIDVHALEPEPETAARLRQNRDLNGVRVSVHEVALGRESGRGRLRRTGPLGRGDFSIVNGSSAAIDVEMVSYADLLETIGRRPEVVKIDIEGAETTVVPQLFDGDPRAWPRSVFLESHPQLIGVDKDDALKSAFLVRGYEEVWASRRNDEVHRQFRRS